MMQKMLIVVLIILNTCLFVGGCVKKERPYTQGFIEGQFIYLSSSQSGLLEKLAIYRGNYVKTDQLIFVLDPNPQLARLQQAKAKLDEAKQNLNNLITAQRTTVIEGLLAQRAQARANLILSEQVLKRRKQLLEQHAIDKESVDIAQSDYEAKAQRLKETEANLAEAKLGSREHLILAQQANVEAAEDEVNALNWELQQKTVNAPKSGQIFDTFFKEGEYVAAGNAVAALITPDNIKLIFYIPQPLRSSLKLGNLVFFSCDSCPAYYQAIINYISPEAEYTPPVIYSRESREKLVYRVEANMTPKLAVKFHPGQPVDIFLDFK